MPQDTESGDWHLLDEMLERGDVDFVEAFRRQTDPEALGRFADRWYGDRRPASRRLFLEYLDRPLNAYRHEVVIKRLFKRAEADGDDLLMAAFLVAFDRSVRRRRSRTVHHVQEAFDDRQKAERLAADWKSRGFEGVGVWEIRRGEFRAFASWSEERLITPGHIIMPRGRRLWFDRNWNPRPQERSDFFVPDWAYRINQAWGRYRDAARIPEPARKLLERFRLFTTKTRHYLRRRAWRYFRKLGRTHPDRYLPAITEALIRYEDADVADGLALLDNWGLVHALFHHSEVLEAKATGWVVAEGKSLADLAPAPIHAKLWSASPGSFVPLLAAARSRAVRRWAALMIERDLEGVRAAVPAEDLLPLLNHADGEVAACAGRLLLGNPWLAQVAPSRWLEVAQSVQPEAVGTLATLMEQAVRPASLALGDAVELACLAPRPLARLGLTWLEDRVVTCQEDATVILRLLEGRSEALRPELLSLARRLLNASPAFQTDWILEFLDSRHADARAAGWAWLRELPTSRDEIRIWRRLIESPYDDVRQPLIAELDARLLGRDPATTDVGSDPHSLHLLWASVVLNVHRGSRIKPRVLDQIARRLERRPEEAGTLLPLLGAALRSVRASERRTGLAAVVGVAERRPDLLGAIRLAFPELEWG